MGIGDGLVFGIVSEDLLRLDLFPYVWRRTKAYHKNILFCIQTVPTFSRLYANEVRGYPNGNYGYYYSVALWGDCDYLLDFERTKSP